MTYTYKYPRPAVTADCVVITKEKQPKVLLIQRGADPYKGCWAFPGGFMNMDETTEQCAIRELEVDFVVNRGNHRCYIQSAFAINDEEDYKKCRNYWKYLKGKLSKDGIQLVSVTNLFKFEAPDGKQRAADALDAECVQTLAKHYPNNRANAFLDWFVYSDNTIDGQSKKKAYTLVESGLLETLKPGTDRPH